MVLVVLLFLTEQRYVFFLNKQKFLTLKVRETAKIFSVVRNVSGCVACRTRYVAKRQGVKMERQDPRRGMPWVLAFRVLL